MVAKGNAGGTPPPRTQWRLTVELTRARTRCRYREWWARLTALLHHITPSLLVESFRALQPNIGAGVDCVRWREYEGNAWAAVPRWAQLMPAEDSCAKLSWRAFRRRSRQMQMGDPDGYHPSE